MKDLLDAPTRGGGGWDDLPRPRVVQREDAHGREQTLSKWMEHTLLSNVQKRPPIFIWGVNMRGLQKQRRAIFRKEHVVNHMDFRFTCKERLEWQGRSARCCNLSSSDLIFDPQRTTSYATRTRNLAVCESEFASHRTRHDSNERAKACRCKLLRVPLPPPWRTGCNPTFSLSFHPTTACIPIHSLSLSLSWHPTRTIASRVWSHSNFVEVDPIHPSHEVATRLTAKLFEGPFCFPPGWFHVKLRFTWS